MVSTLGFVALTFTLMNPGSTPLKFVNSSKNPLTVHVTAVPVVGAKPSTTPHVFAVSPLN